MVTTAGVTLLTVSAYDATGMTDGLAGVVLVLPALGSVLDGTRNWVTFPRLHAHNKAKRITRLPIAPARMHDFILDKLISPSFMKYDYSFGGEQMIL